MGINRFLPPLKKGFQDGPNCRLEGSGWWGEATRSEGSTHLPGVLARGGDNPHALISTPKYDLGVAVLPGLLGSPLGTGLDSVQERSRVQLD